MEIRISNVPVGETLNVLAVSVYSCQQMSEYLIPTRHKASGYPQGPIIFSNLSADYAEYSSCLVKTSHM